jgi:S1-C subfamily serine protease
MKKNVQFFFVACLGSFISLFSAYLFFYFNNNVPDHLKYSLTSSKNILPILNNGNSSGSIIDFTLPAEKSLPAVVHIKTSSEQVNNLSYDPFADWFFGQQKRQQGFTQQGSGSGVIISDNGYIVTNNHVISGADKIEVTLNDKRSYIARIIGFDASTDVALIKIEQKGLPFLLY